MVKEHLRHPKYNEFLVACCASPGQADDLLQSYPELLEAKDGVGETPLHYLAIENRCEAVEFLLQRGAQVNSRSNSQSTPLIHAAKIGLNKMVAILLGAGADPNLIDNITGSALHASVAYEGADPEIVSLLLDHGAQVDIRDPLDGTPLMEAVKRGKCELAQILLRRGADPNARNFGDTILHIAVTSRNYSFAMIELLLRAGADPRALNESNQRPYQIAMESGNMEAAQLLRSATGAQ